MSIEKATGRRLKFKAFDVAGNIRALILDMEAAQVQGLGDALVRLQMNNPAISGINETDPEILVQFIIKLCTVHFERCVVIEYTGTLLMSESYHTGALPIFLIYLELKLLNTSTNSERFSHLLTLMHGINSVQTIQVRS